MPFNVISFNVNSNEFEAYDVMPYFIDCYKEAKKRKKQPKTFDEFKGFIQGKSMYMYWSRCQWEIVLVDWPCGDIQKKFDVHWQIMNNLDLVTEVLMKNVEVFVKK